MRAGNEREAIDGNWRGGRERGQGRPLYFVNRFLLLRSCICGAEERIETDSENVSFLHFDIMNLRSIGLSRFRS